MAEDIHGRFDAAYALIFEHRGYIDAQTTDHSEPDILGVSLECSSNGDAIDNSQVRKIVYRHYMIPGGPHKPVGVHAELTADSHHVDPYFAQTFATGIGPDVIYDYKEVWHRDDVGRQQERIMSFIERALAKLVLRPE